MNQSKPLKSSNIERIESREADREDSFMLLLMATTIISQKPSTSQFLAFQCSWHSILSKNENSVQILS